MQVPTVSNRLRLLRQTHEPRLRLVDVAKVIDKDPTMVTRYERGLSAPPDDVKLALAELYNVSVEHLMGWDAEPQEAA